MTILLRMLLILIICIAGVHLALYFVQEKLIFFPTRTPLTQKYSTRAPFEEIFLETEGATLHALHFKALHPKGLILYFHGNAGDLGTWSSVGDELAQQNYDVLIFDYRGFGKSSGRIFSEQQWFADAEKMYDYAKRFYQDSQITLFGRSIGSGLAVRLASVHPVRRLILETPFLNLKSMSRTRYPYILPFVLKYPMQSDQDAPQVRCPVVVFHGLEDEVIPFHFGAELSKRFMIPVTFIQIPGGHHNDLSLFEAYRDGLRSALK